MRVETLGSETSAEVSMPPRLTARFDQSDEEKEKCTYSDFTFETQIVDLDPERLRVNFQPSSIINAVRKAFESVKSSKVSKSGRYIF